MEVKIVSKKLIKPIVATPDSLRKYKISCMDEVNATMNVVTILYYPFNQFYTYKGIIKTLETSLSRILPRFYPFAGRYIKEHHTVDCNDAGAEFMEAEVDAYDLKQVITNLEPDYLNELLPLEIGAADEITDPVCAVKVTKFRCGGIALAASVSHRIVDACSMGIFVSAWAEEATLREGQSRTIHPDFYSPSYLPGKNFPPEDFGVRRTREGSTVVCKRLIFDAAAIATLRQRVSHLSSVQSRVTVATAFLTEILMRIDRRIRGGIPRACQVTQCINIRERTKNPVVAKGFGKAYATAGIYFPTTSW
ncbi:hypothetical protein BVRB_1g021180 [Beta vulgaris subsp. vulgaris]|nr:hypothetical protein BVRB_1g021180 [Beta vulgaris subsp. vulgaris]